MTGQRKTRLGRVVSDRMDKTAVVAVEALIQHPLYKKSIRRAVKYHAHDENNECKVGDNTGARQLMCIGILGGTRKKYARVGDIVVASVKKAIPGAAVKKGDVKNLETTLESVLESSKSVWSTIVDKYIDYPEKNMKMKMIVQEKTG